MAHIEVKTENPTPSPQWLKNAVIYELILKHLLLQMEKEVDQEAGRLEVQKKNWNI